MLPTGIVGEYKDLITSILLGLLIGYSYDNFLLVLLVSIFYYFKSSLDYLNKTLLYKSLTGLVLVILFALLAIALHNGLLTIIACAGLIRFLRE